jgi:hypothetical protein
MHTVVIVSCVSAVSTLRLLHRGRGVVGRVLDSPE